MKSPNDKNIVDKLNQGNVQAIADIFLSYYKKMYSFAANMINDTEAAHDIVLDVLLKVWENRDMEIHSSLANYLLSATRNSCINYLHTLHVEDRNNQKWMQAHIASDTIYAVEDEDMRRQIESLATDLPKQCKEVFMLRTFEGYSYKEIAEKLKISQDAVKVQLHRAVQKLRKKLSEVKDIQMLLAIIMILMKL